MPTIARLTLKDGLGFPSGMISPATYKCVIFCSVPDAWLDGSALLPKKQELLFEKMYGKTWRNGNEDGSYYAVLESEAAKLTPEATADPKWRNLKSDAKTKYWFWKFDGKSIIEAPPAEL